MAEYTKVMTEYKRLCKSNNAFCNDCVMGNKKESKGLTCKGFLIEHSIEAEEIIMTWAEKHPVKTNADKFKEVFGFKMSTVHHICASVSCPPERYGYDECDECECNGFWDKEYKEPVKEGE